MSFALLADSTSEDPRELLKKANAKETTKPEVVAEAPSQNQNKPKSAGKRDDKGSFKTQNTGTICHYFSKRRLY